MLTNCAVSHQGHDAHRPPPAEQDGSPVPGLTREKKMEGVVLKTFTNSLWRTYSRYLSQKNLLQSQLIARLGPKRPRQAARNIGKFTRACQIAQMSKRISKISISIWKCDLTLRTKIDYIYFERHPVLKFAASWTGSLLTQRMITNCSEKPSLKSSPTLSPNKASWLPLETRQGRHELLKPTTADSDGLLWNSQEPDMEDELNFKTLFLRNLHPA